MAEIAGLKLIVPSSVAGSGVSVSASGKVTFTAATSVSVNGVFDSTYDNYLVLYTAELASGSEFVYLRMRATGSDNSTASSYVRQRLFASSTSIPGDRESNSYLRLLAAYDFGPSGAHVYFYGPYLTQPTAMRAVSALSGTGATINEAVGTHNQSTAYDGFTIYPAASSITGTLQIFGLSQ